MNAFLGSGFLPEKESPAMKSLVMNSARYLRLLRERPAAHSADIYITEIDKARLRSLLDLELGRTFSSWSTRSSEPSSSIQGR